MTPHPIQYQGSKRNLAVKILAYFPGGVGRVVEPFAGSAAISVAAAEKKIGKKYLLNDLNAPLVSLLEKIVEEPDRAVAEYKKIWSAQFPDSVSHYYQVREEFNKTRNPFLLLYLLSRCVKGAVRYNHEGNFNQSPDKRRNGAGLPNMEKNIRGMSALLKGKTQFFSSDYKKILSKVKSEDLVYMDPPYQGVCKNKDPRYVSGISHKEYVGEISALNDRGIDYIISYDGRCGNRLYGETFPKHLNLRKIDLNAGRSTQATLLGRSEITVESVYLSPRLFEKISKSNEKEPQQSALALGG